ncbi:MAG TPA: hypothetical protein VII69_08925 [Candidatus Eremiobacteraceae bacterium]
MPRSAPVNRRIRPRPVLGRQAAAARIYNVALLVSLILFAVALAFVR